MNSDKSSVIRGKAGLAVVVFPVLLSLALPLQAQDSNGSRSVELPSRRLSIQSNSEYMVRASFPSAKEVNDVILSSDKSQTTSFNYLQMMPDQKFPLIDGALNFYKTNKEARADYTGMVYLGYSLLSGRSIYQQEPPPALSKNGQ